MAESILAYGAVRIQVTKASGVSFPLTTVLDVQEAYIESKDLDAGDPNVFKLLRAVIFQMSNSGAFPNLKLILKTRNRLNEPFRSVTLDASSTDDPIKTRVRNCKYFRIRLQDDGVTVRWHLTRIDVYGAVAGLRL